MTSVLTKGIVFDGNHEWLKHGFHFAFELGSTYRKMNWGIFELGSINTKM